ncbi:lanthionine biosynthesis protein [Archangium violaceum Cb vi76]|uniref:Lanthionine biosynthesis protein n=1 Tax=Archangium violaceum Cb vi76 TaxID=1406225 RepID=A0A084T1I8_9BACT|nr:lanthionine biosynthesis protein [Archangium violaceum Cb vi76]
MLGAGSGGGWSDEALRRSRERLRQWVEEPVVREALFLASPSLDESLSIWLSAPESERGQKVERSLVRYFSRMAGRATPFGLFASNGVGRVDTATRLSIGGRGTLRKHTRLDAEYVWSLAEALQRQPEVRESLRFFRSTSIHATPNQYRYVEARQSGEKRTYGLVAVARSSHLDAVLERARTGATLAELAQLLVDAEPDLSLEEARQYIESLAESQLLEPEFAPPLTGPEPVPALLTQTRRLAPLASVSERLASVQAMLQKMDEMAPGLGPESYREVAHALEGLPVPVEVGRLFQVDTLRPNAGVTLSQRVTDELLRGVEVIRRITPRTETLEPLRQFRERFVARYEERSVPLLEALDEERGIGFALDARPGAATGPLLQGFAFPLRGRDQARVDRRWPYLLRLVDSVHRGGRQELALTPEDVDALEVEDPIQLPDSLGLAGTLAGRSAEAVDRGEFRFLLDFLYGPSGATLLGRFCQGDPELTALVRQHLEAEEALRPHAVFAEVVHMPDDRRMGNILGRPNLRRHDLVFMGQSGLPGEARIEPEDLLLSVEGTRLVLRSRRLGKEVIPRLTSAHNFAMYGLGVYRFLSILQAQDGQGGAFHWGLLQHSPFLPRVTYRKMVLSLARWNVDRAQLQEWSRPQGAERFEAVQRFRQAMRLPRWICLRDGDNLLPIDLDSPLSVNTLVHLVKDRSLATLEEMFPGVDELPVEGSDGRYVNSLVIPFVRAPATQPSAPATPRERPAPPPLRRRFPPGSEWLYLKLYAGAASVDRLLRNELGDTIREVLASGAADRWFFLRYRDPDFHLRLRFHGDPSRLQSEVWPRLRDTCEKVLEEGTGWRLQLDTYEREVERYGGPAGIELAEELFAADSSAALELVRAYGGDRGADLRWRLLLKGMDLMLDDLGLPLAERLSVVQAMRTGFGAEFSVDRSTRFEEQLSQRMRRERKVLETILSAGQASTGPLQPGLAAFQQRSARVKPVAERLRLAAEQGALTVSIKGLAESLLHMQVNRVLADEHRRHELILYDFLTRLYRSALARGR